VAEFVCGVRERDPKYLSACKNLPEYRDTGYCVLHFPGEKKEDFEQVKKDKLEREDYDFRGTVFPEGTSDFSRFVFDGEADFPGATFVGKADFSFTQFSGERTNFQGAQFSGERTDFHEAQFNGEWTSFLGAQFSGEWTHFQGTQFSGERTNFQGAQFSGERTDFSFTQFSGERTYFEYAKFSGEWTYFHRAQFGSAEISFQEAHFAKEVSFTEVTFGEKVTFWGTQENPVFGPGAWAHFDRPRIEKPELLTFNTVLLHPGWFINADVRKVDFTDVKWYGMPGGPKGTLDEELSTLEEHNVEARHTLLAQACRRLSANAEENREYPLANEFHYWSMDATRKGDWSFFEDLPWRDLLKRKSWPTIARHFGLITSLYWALSGYGVRAARAFWILVSLWGVFAALYLLIVESSPFLVFSTADIWQGIDYARQAAVYSLSALVRLNPRPQSETLDWFQTLVTIEGILGPIQIALLALAIRRKVMR
jgi:uncharacterized protein YjbI with pentapeptide repeats